MYFLKAVAKGKTVPLQEVNDPVFSQEILGKGVAVVLSDGKLYAPADGEIIMVCDTLHAFSMRTDYGAEILVHIGLDTVKMRGEGFAFYVKAGEQVKEGQLLAKINLRKLKWAGYDMVTPVVVCNWETFGGLHVISGNDVKPGDVVLTLEQQLSEGKQEVVK